MYDLCMTAEPLDPADTADSREVPTSEARARFPELVESARGGEFVYLTRYGNRVAALVPADVAENYERLEDEYWARRASEARASGQDLVPWAEAVAELEGDSANARP